MPIRRKLRTALPLLAALLVAAANVTAQTPPATPALFPIRAGELHGLIDASGRVVFAPEYADIKIGDPLVMLRKGTRTAYAEPGGRIVVPPQEAWTQPFSEGVVPTAVKDAATGRYRWGYAEPAGTLAIAATFDEARPLAGGLAVIGQLDAWGTMKYGAIDRSGRLVVPAVHDKLLGPAGGLVRSESKERRHRVFDAKGRDITPANVDFVGIPSERMVRVWSGRTQGFMSSTGELRVAPAYQQAGDFKEGRAKVWIDGQYGFVDAGGGLVVPARFDTAEDFADGLALVSRDGRSFYIDLEGKVAIEPQVERATSFSGGLAAVRVAGKHGYIDRRGRFAIEPQYSYARPFVNGLAYVGLGRESLYIRPDGQVVWRSASP